MKRRVALALALAALAAAAVAGLATAHALEAADELERARAGLVELRDGGASTQAALTSLRRADEDVSAADEVLSRWPVDVMAAVPVVGRSWAAERAVARSATEVVGAARLLAERVAALRAGAGGVELAALADLRADLAGPVQRGASEYDELRSTPLGLTPPQVSRGVTQAREALGPAVDALRQADTGLTAVSGLLGASGPRSVLVILQNNAELRGSGGYTSSFATGRTQDGRLLLEPLQDLIEVADPPETDRYLPAPQEYVEDFQTYGGNSTMWRTWNMSPHVPDSAVVGARIAGAVTGREPDVVVLLDVPAMGALAALGGTAITLPDGSVVQPSELTDALLVDAYAGAGTDSEAQVRRRVQLQAAATAAVSRLLGGDVPAEELARPLVRLADQRHLAVWSARPAEQQALERLGVAGQLVPPRGGDLVHVSVNNTGANKLDLYVDRRVSVTAEVGPSSAAVTQRVSFTNAAPPDLVPYVAGVERPGVVISRVELSLPPAARDLRPTIDGKPWVGALHEGGGRSRLITRLELPRGASSVLEVRYTLPLTDGRYHLALVPQPLAEDAVLRLAVLPADGEALGSVEGADVVGGRVEEEVPLSETRDVVAELERETPSRWERLKDWWNSPVELG